MVYWRAWNVFPENSSVQSLSRVWPSRLPCPSPTPRASSNSCPLSQWCHPTISASVVPFSSCLQSFPASGSFLISRLLTLCSQNIGASASVSVLPMNIQSWFPLGLTGLISLRIKGDYVCCLIFFSIVSEKEIAVVVHHWTTIGELNLVIDFTIWLRYVNGLHWLFTLWMLC